MMINQDQRCATFDASHRDDKAKVYCDIHVSAWTRAPGNPCEAVKAFIARERRCATYDASHPDEKGEVWCDIHQSEWTIARGNPCEAVKAYVAAAQVGRAAAPTSA